MYDDYDDYDDDPDFHILEGDDEDHDFQIYDGDLEHDMKMDYLTGEWEDEDRYLDRRNQQQNQQNQQRLYNNAAYSYDNRKSCGCMTAVVLVVIILALIF